MASAKPLINILHLAARYGRGLLVLGLLAGILLPGLAQAMRPWLQELIAILMFLAALRIGPRSALGAMNDAPKMLTIAVITQLILPLLLIVLFWWFGILNTNLATALILMAAAPSISGSPNLTIMMGADPAPALRLMVIGTVLLPLTVLPVFYWLPALGSPALVMAAAAKLLAVIAVATVLAFVLRARIIPDLISETAKAIDGASALALAVVVIGLMSSVGSTLASDPFEFARWLGLAFAANFGLQFVAYQLFDKTVASSERTPFSIIAGNRNIALFLVALPPAIIDPVLLFIGCYQIPMYLTPLLLKRLYAEKKA